jgi:hypothetical protein
LRKILILRSKKEIIIIIIIISVVKALRCWHPNRARISTRNEKRGRWRHVYTHVHPRSTPHTRQRAVGTNTNLVSIILSLSHICYSSSITLLHRFKTVFHLWLLKSCIRLVAPEFSISHDVIIIIKCFVRSIDRSRVFIQFCSAGQLAACTMCFSNSKQSCSWILHQTPADSSRGVAAVCTSIYPSVWMNNLYVAAGDRGRWLWVFIIFIINVVPCEIVLPIYFFDPASSQT